MIDSFKLFFEARQEFVDQIQDAVDKVSDRPFNDLFQGKGDRFLVKVFNPKFQRAAQHLGLFNYEFDFPNRQLQGKNINTALKQKMQELMTNHKGTDISHIKEKLINNFMKYKIEIYDTNPLDRITELLVAQQPYFETGSKGAYHLYSNDKSFIMELVGNDYIKKNYPLNETLDVHAISKLLDDMIHLRVEFVFGGWLDSLTKLGEGIVASIQVPFNQMKEKLLEPINHLRTLKQTIDQNNMFYYLLFSRHPIDVLRMADHKGISSCHRLGGGKYSSDDGPYHDCAIADAQNDGGIVYLIKGSDGKKIRAQLNDKDIFHDSDRNTGCISPIGRIRLRRFIDLQTGKDFAVPTTLQSDQKYGYITPDIYESILKYVRENQPIYKNPPESEYARDNIVLVGGTYSDEELSHLMNNFFGSNRFNNISHKEGSMVGWVDEVAGIIENIVPTLKPEIDFTAQVTRHRYGDLVIMVRVITHLALPYNQTWNVDHFDRVLSEHIDANTVITNNLFSSKPRNLMRNTSQKSVWNKGILSSEIAFNVDDPQDLYPILESMIKKRKIWKLFQQIISSDFQYKMDSLVED